MKRLVVLFLTSLLLVACGTPSEEKDKAVATPTATAIPDADVEKEQVDINGHHYEYIRYKIRDGKIYLLSLKTKENDLIIPSEIEGLPVEEVGVDFYLEPENEGYEDFDVYGLYWLLDKNQVYDKVVFSNGIHKVKSMIGIVAEEVIFGNDIEYIATSSLDGEIAEVKVKNVRFECRNVEIETSAFVHCSAEEVDFSPDFGGTVAMGAFSSNHIKKITWPGGKTKVGSEAFANNKELHTVIFPENCEEITIPHECFRGCENLNKLVFPAHVKKVVYESSACADNYDFQGVETLEFKGKDTELV
ncbi:MAG: leucine-rich repeat protein, partial [Eubacterium sp.]|nr:leucine-rich repeat protein [Eubacterium sp.]